MIDDYLAPQSDLRRLFIMRSPAHAAIMNSRFRDDRKLHFAAPFSCPGGWHADVVIWTTDPWDEEYPPEIMDRWVREWILCRLMPESHGQIYLDHIPDFLQKVFKPC